MPSYPDVYVSKKMVDVACMALGNFIREYNTKDLEFDLVILFLSLQYWKGITDMKLNRIYYRSQCPQL
jgi:hypothetical protein